MEVLLNYVCDEEEVVGTAGTTDDVDKLPVAQSASETKEEIPSSTALALDTAASPTEAVQAVTDCVSPNKKNENEDTSNKATVVTANVDKSLVGAPAANSATDLETPNSNHSLKETAESPTVIAKDISENHGEVGDDSSQKSTKVDGTDGNTKEPTPAETSDSSDFDFPVNEAS